MAYPVAGMGQKPKKTQSLGQEMLKKVAKGPTKLARFGMKMQHIIRLGMQWFPSRRVEGASFVFPEWLSYVVRMLFNG